MEKLMAILKVTSPYDRHLIAEIPMQGFEDVERALEKAHALYLDRSRWLKPYERIAILEKTLVILRNRRDELIRRAAEEGGKPLIDSRIEIDRGLQGIQVAIQSIGSLRGEEVPMELTASSVNRMAFTFREPIGVVAAVSAFNHPFNLIVHQVIPAIAAGCPVIVKPALSTPLSCINLVNALYEAGLPHEWAQVVVCDHAAAEKLVTDKRVAYFSFIGSGDVGWSLRSKLAPGTRYALEHGGAAPVIVESDADFSDMIPLLAKGGFYHAGQVCVSVQRVFVHESVAGSVAERLAAACGHFNVGDPLSEKTDVGPLILEKEVTRVDEWVEEARAGGGRILCGGKMLSDTCYAPTVILAPPAGARVSTQEIFGPVICVYLYSHRHEAIRRANALPYAFQASVFTKNIDLAIDTVRRLDASAVMVNDHTAFRVDWMPFGGRRESGAGVGGIPYSMKELTQEKLMVLKSKMI
jgi:acyl-CoA reductase-like NAD-dependent aldehyde dehydrogenase